MQNMTCLGYCEKIATAGEMVPESYFHGLEGNSVEAMVQVIMSTMAARDPYTVGHQDRVSHIAGEIAHGMGLTAQQQTDLTLACRLHDLGKVAVPTEILSKPGRLTSLETAMIRTHPQVGTEILKPLTCLHDVSRIILQHHERLDGSGYPLGLRGDDISLEARILGVADVVEAMCSHRPYRPSLGMDQALDEIKRNQGILYDPEVVTACLDIYGGESAPVHPLPAREKLTRPTAPEGLPPGLAKGLKTPPRPWLSEPRRWALRILNSSRFHLQATVIMVAALIVMTGRT
jgi:HD-GYP domain-containing protein (c-di-GMP phosphodiesterase class II)